MIIDKEMRERKESYENRYLVFGDAKCGRPRVERKIGLVKAWKNEQVLESEMGGERSRDRAKHGPEDRWEP